MVIEVLTVMINVAADDTFQHYTTPLPPILGQPTVVPVA